MKTMSPEEDRLVQETAQEAVTAGWDKAIEYIASMAGKAADTMAMSGSTLTGPQALRRFGEAISVFRLGDAQPSTNGMGE